MYSILCCDASKRFALQLQITDTEQKNIGNKMENQFNNIITWPSSQRLQTLSVRWAFL